MDSEEKKVPTVLVVDDEEHIRLLIRENLRKIGFPTVIEAKNGKEAVAKAIRFVPSLILMDLRMPEMDGYEACRSIKKRKELENIPIIIVSAMMDLKNKAEAYKSGADDFIGKPIDVITLAARIRSILETTELRKKINKMADSKALSNNIFNFNFVYERLVEVLEKCRRRSLPFSILYIDIDYMKMINSEYGKKVGDNVIHQVRNLIFEYVKERGIILSSNSDKFLVMLSGIDERKVNVVADDIMSQIKKIHLPVDPDGKMNASFVPSKPYLSGISLSIGIVTWDKADSIPAEKLIDLTENALNEAKGKGRGKKVQYQFYSNLKPEGDKVKVDKIVERDYGRQDEY